MLSTRASQPFFTLASHAFYHGPLSSDYLIEIYFFSCSLFFFICSFILIFFLLYKICATIITFYVNSSHVIYIPYLCPHYVYVTRHFSVDLNVLAPWTPLVSPGLNCAYVSFHPSFQRLFFVGNLILKLR